MDTVDVIVVGYGPVGQTLCALLGHAGYSVAAFERNGAIAGSAKAIHCDDEIMRLMERIGAGPEIREDAATWATYDTRTAAFGGELLRRFDWSATGPHGWQAHWSFYQPHLEAAIDRVARATGRVLVRFNTEAIELAQDADGVTATVRDTATGEQRTVRGRHLVGADGANSFVRQALDVPVTAGASGTKRLVIDVAERRPKSFELENGHFLDPRRPGCLFRLGRSHRRFEFHVFDHESRADFTEARLWDLLEPWGGPDDFTLCQRPVIRFQETMADTWQRGRCFLIGDAAHTMWPFAGQGMCSGMRDAATLAWRLHLLYRGIAHQSILDTFTADRMANVRAWTDRARAVGEPCVMLDPDQIEARNATMRAQLAEQAVAAPPAPPGPTAFARVGDPTAGAGGMQGRVAIGDRTGLFDELVGHGFVLISTSADTLRAIDPDRASALGDVGVTIARLGAEITDVDGAYQRWLSDLDADTVLVRPDYHVYGASTGAKDGLDLLDGFLSALTRGVR
ncbi:MAG TPA: bifunctional 3-(3-hydroxy-phenyl)propionate/3-hydroxycinnamic acid hydroxylase [Pseudonocardiaceae bacterium]|nr:bifunctional 3-(3-hydroxy-phenyl)propionate/3-hydroxycinnamic acid hydroxylase [Pseudonocardiaceae bacterium]